MAIEWFAAGATMIAALMTAASLGARVTGWGFAMFALGSAAWITATLMATEPNTSVLVMHGVLLPVDLFGVWRWLGRERRYEDSGAQVTERTRWKRVPTLFSGGALIGADVRVQAGEGKSRGTVVDAMFTSEGKRMAYMVISEGGIGGAGETLRAVPPDHLRFEKDEVFCDLDEAQWSSLPPIENDRWPTEAPAPRKGDAHL